MHETRDASGPGAPGREEPAGTEARQGAQAEAWVAASVRRCVAAWERVGARYARRLASQDRVREPLGDVMTLAARQVLPLARPVLRPLPDDHLPAIARAFNRLEAPDRYALARLDVLGRLQGARAEHLASALERLVVACREARAAPEDRTREEGDPPCPGRSRGLQT